MKKEFWLGFMLTMAFITIISREHVLLYGTLTTLSALKFGREVEKDEE